MKELPKHLVSIHGVPRSGTSWLGQIFNSSPNVAFRFQPLFSYAFKNRLGPNSTKEELADFFRDIYETKDEFVLQLKNISGNKEVDFLKNENPTHLIMKEVRYHHILQNLITNQPKIKVIGLVRNPCGCINSWLRAPKEFKPEWNELEEWRKAPSKNLDRPEEFNGFEKWKEVASMFLGFSEKYPDNFKLIQYEKLNNDTLKCVKELFNFCELELGEQTKDFINLSRNNDSKDAYSVFRKGQVNDSWVTQLNPIIAQSIISELKSTPLEQFLI